MKVTIRIPSCLRRYTGGTERIEATGRSVAEAFKDMGSRFDGWDTACMEESGALKRYFHLFVNDRDIQTFGGFDTRLRDGDELTFLPVATGGATLSKKLLLTVHGGDVHEPIIYTIGKKFDVIPNVEGASIANGIGIIAMAISGEEEEIERVLAFLDKKEIRVEHLN